MNLSTADSQEIDDGLLLMNLGETSIHELLHTIRLDHPHNYTQTSDTKLILILVLILKLHLIHIQMFYTIS